MQSINKTDLNKKNIINDKSNLIIPKPKKLKKLKNSAYDSSYDYSDDEYIPEKEENINGNFYT